MTGVIATSPRHKFFDNNGNPAVDYLLYTYAAGTTTPIVTHQDQAQSSANTNPIVLDANGECLLWLATGQEYKFVLKTPGGSTIRTTDDISGADVSGLRADLASTATGKGADLVGYLPAGAGAVATTVTAKLRQAVSVKDYGAVGDGVTDDTAAFVSAIASGAMRILVPHTSNQYIITGPVSIPRGAIMEGDGYYNSKIKCRNDLANFVGFTLDSDAEIRDLQIYGLTTSQGTGVKFTTGTYTFGGHGGLRGVEISGFAIGIDVNSWYNLALDRAQITGNGKGLNATPPTNGGDNGYINGLYVTNSYFYANGTHDVYIAPAIRLSNGRFDNVEFDPGATVAHVYLNTANPVAFENCYWEGGGAGVPAILSHLSDYVVRDGYATNSGGFVADNTQHIIRLEHVRAGSVTDIINAGYALHTLYVTDSNFPNAGNTIPSSNGRYFRNATINGVTYFQNSPEITIGNGTPIHDVQGWTKSITVTINANTSIVILANQYVSGLFDAASQAVGEATFADSYNPGLILTVTPATTGSADYFSVVATNTTGSAITLTGKRLNVMITRLRGSTAI